MKVLSKQRNPIALDQLTMNFFLSFLSVLVFQPESHLGRIFSSPGQCYSLLVYQSQSKNIILKGGARSNMLKKLHFLVSNLYKCCFVILVQIWYLFDNQIWMFLKLVL